MGGRGWRHHPTPPLHVSLGLTPLVAGGQGEHPRTLRYAPLSGAAPLKGLW